MYFRSAHATHADWRIATQEVVEHLEQQRQSTDFCSGGSVGVVYVTTAWLGQVATILAALKAATGIADWIGAVAQGVVASGVEYVDQPALVVMLLDIPQGSAKIFSGRRRAPSRMARNAKGDWLAECAIVHACANAPDLPELVQDMAGKVHSGRVVGGLTGAQGNTRQIANDILEGGMSGVVLSSQVSLLTRVTQGCQPVGPTHDITQSEGHVIQRLDDVPALDVLLADLGAPPGGLIAEKYMQRLSHGLFVGLAAAGGDATTDYQVRHLIAIDPDKRSLTITEPTQLQQQLLFCTRDATVARHDLNRMCIDIKESLKLTPIKGALYYTCASRGAQLFGAASAEMQMIRAHFGDIPLVGFFDSGEILGDRLYAHSGVLSLFY